MSDERFNDARLRDAYARAVEARQVPDRAACPTPDALLAVVRRDGSEEVRLRTLDHAMTCPECGRELELLRSIERAGAANTGAAVRGIRWRRAASIALAASAVLALSLGPGRRLWDDDATIRGGESGVVLIAPPVGESVGATSALTFTWHAVPTAHRYDLEILAPDGTVALARQTTDTSLTLGAPTGLVSGAYRWWVTAQTEDGARVRSEARALALRTP
jgi:hypothetical protein